MLGRFLEWLANSADLTPHGFGLPWGPELLWLYAGADFMTALAYLSIPMALAMLVRRRRDLAFGWVFWLFAALVSLCGLTHLLGLLTIWVPLYTLEGTVKAVAAVVSVATAAVLWPLLPKAVALPSQASLRTLNEELSRQVAERDELLAALRRSEDRHRATFERSPTPLHTLDEEGRLVNVSDSWLELMGRERADVLGRPVSDFFAPGPPGWTLEQRRKIMAQAGEVRNVERRYMRPDGSIIDAVLTARAESHGGVQWLSCSVLDVTARRQAEAALRESEDRLRQSQKMEAIGRLTGGVAHDFNNMLQVMDTSLGMLRERVTRGDANVGRFVDAALEASGRAAKLTAQLLSFSRRQRLEPRALEPAEVVEGMRALLGRTVGDRATLLVEVPRPGAWRCMADRNQLESALLNLVINARDAVADGGTIRVSSGPATFAEPPPGADDPPPPGEYVRITVSDDGCGMTDEVRRRAFEPFFTTKPQGEGTGLGLAQIYGFARQSGGTVEIETAPGAGSSISILLPRAADAPEPEVPAEAPEPRRAQPGETVLLVEDEPQLLWLCADTVRRLGYEVLEARDAEAAMAIVREGTWFDVLLTDVAMPGSMDGVALAARVHALRPEVAVVYASGHFGAERRPGAVEGAAVLQKPFTPLELGEALRGALDRPRRASGA